MVLGIRKHNTREHVKLDPNHIRVSYSWFIRLLLVLVSLSTRILFVFLVITDDTKPSCPEATQTLLAGVLWILAGMF